MDLYNLGPVGWVESQSIYHALALLGREGLVICYPAEHYVCLGLHDDLDYEINLPYCRQTGIPLLRRETGGGVVYLDDRQVFFQLVLRRDNPVLPLRRHRFYEKFLQPALSVYRNLGLPAELKAPADIAVRGRKCSGNASGDIGDCVAYVGNLLLDFDYVTMSQVLRVPDDIYRYYLCQVMQAHMTTLTDWCRHLPEYSDLADSLIAGFENILGDLCSRQVDAELGKTAQKVGERLISREWLQLPGRRPLVRKVKIAEGVYLSQKKLDAWNSVIVLTGEGIEKEIMV